MEKANYDYQKTAIKNIWDNLDTPNQEATVLAAATGSGKSYIAKDFIIEYTAKHPNSNIVFLAHGQNILKTQFLDLLKEHITTQFTFGTIGEDKQVCVGLPHYFNTKEVQSIDLLIVDEAHEYYSAGMEQELIKKYNPRHILLLTGSPGIFNKNPKMKMVYIDGNQMLENNEYNSVDLDMVRVSSLSVSNKLRMALNVAENKGDDLNKVMIVCKNINQARLAKGYMVKMDKDVALSTSHNDNTNYEIERFRKDKNCQVLIVVNKGILGFNCSEITLLIDLKGSSDIDIVNQYFSRLLRKHPENKQKYFIRVSDTKKWNKDVKLLHDIVELMNCKTLMSYTKER